MVYGYIRVSTDKQTIENQRYQIKSKYRIDQWFEETISSRVVLEKRVLYKLLNNLNDGDNVIVTELSRIARSMTEMYNIVQLIRNKNVTLTSIKEGFKLDDTQLSKIALAIFSLAAELERDMLSERTKIGLQRVRASGVKLGRPQGLRLSPLWDSIDDIMTMRKTMKLREIAAHFNTSAQNIARILKSQGL